MASSIRAKTDAPAWGASIAIEDRYRPMIQQLEALAAARPGEYRARVYLGATLGYAYIGLIILIILAVIGGALAIMVLNHAFNALTAKLLIPLAILVFLILKATRVKMPPPQGVKITAAEAPDLFAMLKDIRKRLRGPKVQAVYITNDFNAYMSWRGAGIFGRRSVLGLGLPLLRALSREEVMAVVAHEYGHLAGAHGKMSAWVYRVRITWLQLSEAFSEGAGAFVFKRFFNWYGPWFNAYSFVLARDDEYRADRAAAAIATPEVAARALMRAVVETQRHNAFWERLFKAARHEPQVFPHARMANHFVQPMADREADDVLRRAMSAKTDIHDTHPSLSDRLKALQQAPSALPPVTKSGADTLLDVKVVERLMQRFDADWWNRVENEWTESCAAATERDRQIEDFAARRERLSDEEIRHYQYLLEGRGDTAEALEVAQSRLAAQPDDVAARASVGRLQLALGDAAGMDHMQAVLASGVHRLSRLYILEDCLAYLGKQNDDPRLGYYQAQFNDALYIYNLAQHELGHISENVWLEAAELDEDIVAAVRGHAARIPRLKSLWIARHRAQADPGITQLVVLYEGADGLSQDLVATLQAVDGVFAVRRDHKRAWLRKRMNMVPGARLFRR